MERAGEFLGRALRRLDRTEAALAWLTSAWPSIVGQSLASHTRPVRCERGTLDIAAVGAPWTVHIESMQREFCTLINQAWGSTLIREVKFLASCPARLSHELDSTHTPFLRRRKT
jgi:predicted nucleic acid-binding Zn ribbon protein